MSSVDLSICIVNWNRRDLLRGLLNSLNGACAGFVAEIIVVDNASVDASVEMIAADFPDIVLLQNTKNLGFSRANNQALAKARGRNVLFLNNDTIASRGALAAMISFLDQHAGVVAVGARLTGRDGRVRDRYAVLPTLPILLHRLRLMRWLGLFRSAYRRYRRGSFEPNRSQRVEVICGSAILVRREQFLSCGAWDEGFEFGCEDFDLSARLSQIGDLYYLAEAEIVHLGGESSQSNLGFVYCGYECGCARYLAKHAPSRFAPWIYKLLVTVDMPFRILALLMEYGLKRLKGQRERADRTWRRIAAASEFSFYHLFRFWRS